MGFDGWLEAGAVALGDPWGGMGQMGVLMHGMHGKTEAIVVDGGPDAWR